MPRPEYIARLHGALYDLRTCPAADRPEMLRRYHKALTFDLWPLETGRGAFLRAEG